MKKNLPQTKEIPQEHLEIAYSMLKNELYKHYKEHSNITIVTNDCYEGDKSDFTLFVLEDTQKHSQIIGQYNYLGFAKLLDFKKMPLMTELEKAFYEEYLKNLGKSKEKEITNFIEQGKIKTIPLQNKTYEKSNALNQSYSKQEQSKLIKRRKS